MSAVVGFLASSIGRKVTMALSGLLMFLFLVTHLAANLLVLVDPEAYNEYSHALISNPLIYIAEAGLLALFVAHLISGIAVWRKGQTARSISYRDNRWAGGASHKSLASATMIVTGTFFIIFVPLHILWFKFGTYYDAGNGVRDLHRLVVEEFQDPLLVAFYVVGMAVLGFHLWHGIGSAFESLGVAHRPKVRQAGRMIAVVLAGGFMIIPLVIFFTGGGF